MLFRAWGKEEFVKVNQLLKYCQIVILKMTPCLVLCSVLQYVEPMVYLVSMLLSKHSTLISLEYSVDIVR